MKRRHPARAVSAMYLAALAVLLSACGPDRPQTAVADEPLPVPLYFETIGRGRAELADTVEAVLRDSTAWIARREQLIPLRPFTPVDFTQAMVVLVAIPSPSSGYSIDIESVETLEDTLLVSYVLFRPAQDCMIAPAQTVPFTAALARRAPGEAVFEHRVEDVPCTFR